MTFILIAAIVLILVPGIILLRMPLRIRPFRLPSALTGKAQERIHRHACVGDSITHGSVSSNYVRKVRSHFSSQPIEIINCGVNGNLVWNIYKRLDKILEMKPDSITILAGTNDIQSTYSKFWTEFYRRTQFLPKDPSLEWSRETMLAVIARLKKVENLKIALVEIPMIGEDLDSPVNEIVRKYNASLKEIASQEDIDFIPVFDKIAGLLPEDHTPPPYTADFKILQKAMFQRLLLMRNWNTIARKNGLSVLVDHIHLTEGPARIIADSITEWIKKVSPGESS